MSLRPSRAASMPGALALAFALLAGAVPGEAGAQAEAAGPGAQAESPAPATVPDAESVPGPGSEEAPEAETSPGSAGEAPLVPAAGGLAAAPAAPVRPDEPAFQPLAHHLDALRSGAADLEAPVYGARAAARERGVRNLDAAARVLVAANREAGPAPRLAAAEAAVALAPDLPLARVALARALWSRGDRVEAARALGGAFLALDRHLESSIWLRASVAQVLVLALFGGGLLFLGVAALAQAPRASHDLGDAVARDAPGYARAALLGSALLLPAAMGEGALGLALGLFGLCFCYGSARERVAALIAAGALLAAAHPLADRAGTQIAAFSHDPWVEAAFAVEEEAAAPFEVARLDRAANREPLAARALALHAMREERLAEADARYSVLRELAPGDPLVANNAAKLRLALGDTRGAIELLEQASARIRSPVVLFNLSHAYGRAIRLDDQHRALERAQALDADLVGEITQLQGTRPGGFAMALPTPTELLRARLLLDGTGQGVARVLRERLAPGLLGASPLAAAVAFAVVALGTRMLARRFRAASWCGRCGSRLCPRCDGTERAQKLCDGCARLLQRPETTDPTLRVERIEALRQRQQWLDRATLAASFALPGAAGVLGKRPLAGLLGAFLGAGALGCLAGLPSLLPDPLAAGAAGALGFGLAGVLFALGHFALASFARLRGSRT